MDEEFESTSAQTPVDRLKRWRSAALILQKARRFRYIISESESSYCRKISVCELSSQLRGLASNKNNGKSSVGEFYRALYNGCYMDQMVLHGLTEHSIPDHNGSEFACKLLHGLRCLSTVENDGKLKTEEVCAVLFSCCSAFGSDETYWLPELRRILEQVRTPERLIDCKPFITLERNKEDLERHGLTCALRQRGFHLNFDEYNPDGFTKLNSCILSTFDHRAQSSALGSQCRVPSCSPSSYHAVSGAKGKRPMSTFDHSAQSSALGSQCRVPSCSPSSYHAVSGAKGKRPMSLGLGFNGGCHFSAVTSTTTNHDDGYDGHNNADRKGNAHHRDININNPAPNPPGPGGVGFITDHDQGRQVTVVDTHIGFLNDDINPRNRAPAPSRPGGVGSAAASHRDQEGQQVTILDFGIGITDNGTNPDNQPPTLPRGVAVTDFGSSITDSEINRYDLPPVPPRLGGVVFLADHDNLNGQVSAPEVHIDIPNDDINTDDHSAAPPVGVGFIVDHDDQGQEVIPNGNHGYPAGAQMVNAISFQFMPQFFSGFVGQILSRTQSSPWFLNLMAIAMLVWLIVATVEMVYPRLRRGIMVKIRGTATVVSVILALASLLPPPFGWIAAVMISLSLAIVVACA